MPGLLDTNKQSEAYRVGAALKEAKMLGFITDAGVAAANTVAGLRTFVAGVTLPKASSELVRTSVQKAINTGASLGLLTDALILPLTTSDGLIALTGIPSDYRKRGMYD